MLYNVAYFVNIVSIRIVKLLPIAAVILYILFPGIATPSGLLNLALVSNVFLI